MTQAHARSSNGSKSILTAVAALTLSAAGAVHALSGGDAAPNEAPIFDLQMDFSVIEGQAQTQRSQPRITVKAGERASIQLSDARYPSQHTEIDLVAEQADKGFVKISAAIKRGEPLQTVSRPQLITAEGVKGQIEIERDDPSGHQKLSLAITPRRVAAP